jgi:hypothetical protein
VEPEETATARQQQRKHMSVATDMHATTEELLEMVFYMWSVPRLCSEDEQGS